ncbi:2-(1,2-epoxy-1,2-dihydrophenyl)acetyl-CoA isomerase [Litorivivens lipolytica]|uniref:2-(1,2-epoxy-1,2-dihydrophenyl)acetyl-CoA isomerase n=1 Tax=Litorivivens lipolytica TaxID=1524264 RepID=A0A7W4W4F3_9GAMM|nr:enoyl-CoA hydratase-related protein [Litorivivens lipolytica]MBB3047242.1 2-(1,2-epoxy-1,2-dihydrophenyl)acetyl-CoA isomerase [Litorivivens lipolytica]
MSDYQTISYSVDGHVANILLNRPESLNAFNVQMRKELLSAFTEAGENEAVRVVLFGSTGKAFSSGADLMDGLGEQKTVEDQIMKEYFPVLDLMANLNKPIIAAVPGVMAGIGAAFAMNSDLIMMADTGSMLLAFTNIALVPDGGASWQLLRHLGYQRAFQLIAEGGRMSAHECLEAGIANKLVPADELMSEARKWAEELAQRAPVALREVKQLLRKATTLSYAETVALEAKTQNVCLATQDAAEAVKAFVEKRPAVFRGC